MSSEVTKRGEIIRQAYAAFYEQGFQATCVDKLLQKSGISKRTVYKYFRSKEELIAATVAYYQQVTFNEVIEAISTRAHTPAEKILVIFDLKKEALERGEYFGCFAINAHLEFENKNTLIENACGQFFKSLEGFIFELCNEVGCKNPKKTGEQIMVLLDGAIVYGQTKRDPKPAMLAKEMAKSLLSN